MSDFNGKNVIYVNPRFKNPETYQPVSYFLYKILSRVAHIKNLEWVSALGTIADYGFDDCRDILSKYGIRKKNDLERSRLWKAAVILNGAFAIIGFDEGLKIFMKAGNINDLVKNERLHNAFNIFNKEYTRAERDFWKNSMCDDELNLIFSVIESKYKRISSALVTDISIQYPEKVVILLEKLGKSYKVHARHQAGKINLGEIMMRCCNGGGHRQAAGGIVGEHEIDNFREKIVRELESYSR
jgi:single-stranded DNA-specific DHH superfamily exonuclease